MKYSIIIPTYSNFEGLKACLESIEKYTDLTQAEVIVSCNGCPDETLIYLREKPFIVIHNQDPIGYARAVNEGIKYAQGEYLVLLNDDTVLLEQEKNDWLTILESGMVGNVAITGPLLSYSPPAEHNFIIFFCAMIKRILIDEIGKLDTSFGVGGGEDTDYCIKAERAGYSFAQVPNENLSIRDGFMVGSFPIYHKGEATVNQNPEWKQIFEKNSKLLENRYKLPEGWFYGDDIKAYRMLAENIKDGGTICELGSWQGRSLCSIADIIKRKGLRVIAVDTFEGTVNEGDMHSFAKDHDLCDIFASNLERFGIKAEIYKMTTNEASQMVDEPIDLLFIDADHSYEAVKQDIENWKSKVTTYIAGHDFNTWEGVTKAVKEAYPNVQSIGSVWYKKLS